MADRPALFARPAPRWFTIAAHRPFVEDLAAGLHAALSPLGPEALSDAIVLTPTRRAARSLAEAFVKVGGGKALLLDPLLAAVLETQISLVVFPGRPATHPGSCSDQSIL